jgi:hypothetical protein
VREPVALPEFAMLGDLGSLRLIFANPIAFTTEKNQVGQRL